MNDCLGWGPKIDKIYEAVVAMARMEDRINKIERKALIRGQKIAFAECIFCMILTGAVGLCVVYSR